jgi:hypothetical protein
MTKVVGSFESVVRGVSEQVPHQRLSGQQYEQVNMVSDPVRGLSRRQGSKTLAEYQIAGMAALSDVDRAYLRTYREHSFFIDGKEYAVLYPTAARPGGSTLPFMFCFDKTGQRFLPVVTGGDVSSWQSGGISACGSAGQYVLFAGTGVSPTYTVVDKYAATNQIGVGTVRTGQYSRTYSLTIKRADTGAAVTAAYTTMASSYPALLDTSDLSAADPNYQKWVNDRVYAYNSAVTKWIGDAMLDIQPQNIVNKLCASFAAQGFVNAAPSGGTILLSNISAAQSSDGADGDNFRVVFNELDDPIKLSGKHYPNKVVKITPKGAEPYFMRAVPDDPANVNYQNVTWREGAGQEVSPTRAFLMGALHVSGNSFCIADSAASLQTASGVTVPGLAKSVCGSTADEGGLPYFFGKRVTCISMFQDRLVVVANGVIFMSRTGDYFNWFRKSKLTVTDDDPVEMYALGAEDDIIHHAVAYNKDLFLFGQRKQYAVSGRVAMTPKSAAVTAAAGEADATNMRPVTQGNLVFYGKWRPAALQQGSSKFAAELRQFQLGLYQDTPESYPVSQQLSLYMRGKPTQAVTLNGPNTLMVRTDGYDNGVYLYSYMDEAGSQSRKFDAWSRWEWDPQVGSLLAMTTYQNVLLAFVVRTRGAQTWMACESFTIDASESDVPYLDMQRSAQSFEGSTGYIGRSFWTPPGLCAAGTAASGTLKYMGAAVDSTAKYDAFKAQFFPGDANPPAVVGMSFSSYFELTPPYTRDRNGVAVVNGRLVITKYIFRVANTGGMEAWLSDDKKLRSVRVVSFNGRRVGISDNLVGQQPASDAYLTAPVGRANSEHRLKVAAHGWLPMTVTAIAWNGQFFNHSRQG